LLNPFTSDTLAGGVGRRHGFRSLRLSDGGLVQSFVMNMNVNAPLCLLSFSCPKLTRVSMRTLALQTANILSSMHCLPLHRTVPQRPSRLLSLDHNPV
jgi:hypothetical protein